MDGLLSDDRYEGADSTAPVILTVMTQVSI